VLSPPYLLVEDDQRPVAESSRTIRPPADQEVEVLEIHRRNSSGFTIDIRDDIPALAGELPAEIDIAKCPAVKTIGRKPLLQLCVQLAAFPHQARKGMKLDLLEEGEGSRPVNVGKLLQPSLYVVAGNDRLTPAGEEGLEPRAFSQGVHQERYKDPGD
jgi:hypothetical protein